MIDIRINHIQLAWQHWSQGYHEVLCTAVSNYWEEEEKKITEAVGSDYRSCFLLMSFHTVIKLKQM